jgi:hypothetical protein
MTNKERAEILKVKHEELHQKIEDGQSLYLNDVDMKKMKFEKLRIKDEIARLEQFDPDIHQGGVESFR